MPGQEPNGLTQPVIKDGPVGPFTQQHAGLHQTTRNVNEGGRVEINDVGGAVRTDHPAPNSVAEGAVFKEYFVVRRGPEWWIVDDTASFGPYVLRNTAVQAAIGGASKESGSGSNTKVFVEERLMGDMSLVYDSAIYGEVSQLSNAAQSLAGREL